MIAAVVDRWIGKGRVEADLTDEIDQHHIGVTVADTNAYRKGALRIEDDRNSWGADTSLLRLAFGHQALLLERAHKYRHGLRGKTRSFSDLQARGRRLL